LAFPWSSYKKECSAEFVGTYLLVLFGAGSVIVSASLSGTIALVFVACVFGGTVALVILLLGRHSGAHINPAVTLAHAFAKKTRNDLVLPYITFQALRNSRCLNASFVFLESVGDAGRFGSTELAVGVTPIYGLLLEAIGTFLLCSAALAATFYVHQPRRQAALVGGTLFLLILLLGHLTGASFNPARSIGPALSSGHWSNIIVYLVGPFLGAAFAAVPFRLLHIEGQIRD